MPFFPLFPQINLQPKHTAVLCCCERKGSDVDLSETKGSIADRLLQKPRCKIHLPSLEAVIRLLSVWHTTLQQHLISKRSVLWTDFYVCTP